MRNTFQILLNWDKGRAFAERMAAKILAIESYEDIDPQAPVGGPDGTKDIICYKDGKKYVAGCYLPMGQKTFKDIQDKFNDDFKGVAKNSANGFIFLTNQKITPGERITLCKGHTDSTIYHGERICGILDKPKGYGVRLEYLGIELNKEEQISFLNSHLDLRENFEEIKGMLSDIKKVTTRMAGAIPQRDLSFNPVLSTLPLSGVPWSSRISLEDLFAIQRACLYEIDGQKYNSEFLGFRKVDVWIGSAGGDKSNADFVPPEASNVPSLIIELLEWWRNEYMTINYGNEQAKIFSIAQFHEKILTIHPFLDGNGRVARTISSIQFKDLLDKEVKFEKIEPKEYYEALQESRNDNKQALNDIFMSLIK
ncbi:MAG: Fic family protein [Labilibaculum sp.]|nr:Fic family protein [Labilibaculum sp.]MBI9060070.1 Fic family protein [Labilibaculum sp.]